MPLTKAALLPFSCVQTFAGGLLGSTGLLQPWLLTAGCQLLDWYSLSCHQLHPSLYSQFHNNIKATVTAVLGREVTPYNSPTQLQSLLATCCSTACAHQDGGRALGDIERHCLQKDPSLPHERFGVHYHCLKACASPEFKSIKIKGILQNYVLEYPRSSTFSVDY